MYNKKITDIIKKLATKTVTEVIDQASIKKKIKKYMNSAGLSVQIFRNLAVVKQKVVFIDKTKDDISGSHFLAFYLYPKSFYSVSISKYGGYHHISVGCNPWNKIAGTDINIGQMMIKYGGGGHKGVGGAERKSKDEIMKITEEIMEYLNKNG